MSAIRCLAILLPLALGAVPSAGATAPEKMFLGRVLEVDPANKWFRMQGGGSKKYPRVKMVVEKSTRWLGQVPRPARVRTGDFVRARGPLLNGDTFRAVSVELLPKDERPIASGAQKSR